MKNRFFAVLTIVFLCAFFSSGFTQNFDNLVVASEVLLNGETPSGLLFKPGRILDENTIWFCGVDGTNAQTYVFRSVNGGATFTHNADPIAGRAAQMDAFDENIAIVATAEGDIFRTTDGGATFTEVYSYMINIIATGWFDGCRVLNEDVAVAYGDMEPNGNMHFVRSTDKGANWAEIEGIDFLGAAYGYYTWGLASCNVGESIWCSATNVEYDSSFVFRSYDAGVNWEGYKIPVDVIPNYPRSIAFTDDDNGMIAARGGYVIKSTDGGATWSETDNPPVEGAYPNGVVAIPNTNIILVMDDVGVYATTDLGGSYTEITLPPEAADDYMTSGVFLNKDFGFVFTYNGQVFRFEDQLTALPSYTVYAMPAEYQLHQNYPNPFNPGTQIAFSMPEASDVKVVIYDLLGRKVRTVFDGYKGIGTHFILWDGRDDAGQDVASGVYIYSLTAEGVHLSKKMQLVR